jgi:hypothetical protein
LSAGSSQDDSFHIESHEALLQQSSCADEPGPELQRRLDAIVVPTIRPWSISPAVALAGDVGCALVVLCGTADEAEQANRECKALDGDVLVTYVTPDFDEDHLGFLTSGHPETGIEPSCHVDIARKRNAGLMLARLCGWRTIMFLDDDIRGMTASAVSRAAALTARFQAVGFKIGHYPDNSVVCHAHRLAGGTQDVFPGGSALLIDVARNETPFPPIYNEDWLFLFDAARRRSVTAAGTLSQLDYQPFAHPSRATSEEFGDVIAEGLFRLLHEDGSVADASRSYWRHTLRMRSRLIDHIAARLRALEPDPAMTENALTSLDAARERLAGITDDDCVSFVRDWLTDADSWRENQAYVPVLADLADAAKFLNLPTLDGWLHQ